MMNMRTFAALHMCLLLFVSKVFPQEYRHLGCFKDDNIRSIPDLLSKVLAPQQAITTCAGLAKEKGYTLFSVQFKKECYSGPNAEQTYDRYGVADNCKDGIGGDWAADVYTFKVHRHMTFLPPTNNKALVNHVIEEQLMDKYMCIEMCYLNHNCVSYNLGPSPTPGMMICQLNDADRYQYPHDYQDRQGYSYAGNMQNYYT